MTDAFIRVLDKLIDLAKEQIWTAPACITSGVLLVFYQYQVNAFGIYDFLSSNKTILAIMCNHARKIGDNRPYLSGLRRSS